MGWKAESGCGRAAPRMRHKAPYPSPSNLPSEKLGPAVLGLCTREQEAGGDQPVWRTGLWDVSSTRQQTPGRTGLGASGHSLGPAVG